MVTSVTQDVSRLAGAALLIQAVLVCALFGMITPEDLESGRVVLSAGCSVLRDTGRPCSTCGVTRGLAAMGHLQVLRAWHYNPLAVAIYTFDAWVVLRSFVPWVTSRRA
jgi:hypothetical protein